MQQKGLQNQEKSSFQQLGIFQKLHKALNLHQVLEIWLDYYPMMGMFALIVNNSAVEKVLYEIV